MTALDDIEKKNLQIHFFNKKIDFDVNADNIFTALSNSMILANSVMVLALVSLMTINSGYLFLTLTMNIMAE